MAGDDSARDQRLRRALASLDGLSVGDAFGQRFFGPEDEVLRRLARRTLPQAPWRYTDDTEMAIAIVEILRSHDSVDQDALALAFARRYAADPGRGYGQAAHEILQKIGAQVPWRWAAQQAFDGAGSMGNGAAMRAAPVGAYFADDLDVVVEQARASAEVTHHHADGQAGAIAVAVAAAWAMRVGEGRTRSASARLLETVLQYTPPGATRDGIERALQLPLISSIDDAVNALGNGGQVIASDTVPFALWCAARHIDNYQAALWATVSGLGDRDTTCAIVGGIVVLAADRLSIPPAWLAAREPLALAAPPRPT
ncbi:MAG: ADP-ribosylglycohydrolase family protein [Deltaproteobacteria bacterium]|nr:ADP-ribosylglycohydrolase family protein [Deltaproteobacteria bacterium]